PYGDDAAVLLAAFRSVSSGAGAPAVGLAAALSFSLPSGTPSPSGRRRSPGCCRREPGWSCAGWPSAGGLDLDRLVLPTLPVIRRHGRVSDLLLPLRTEGDGAADGRRLRGLLPHHRVPQDFIQLEVVHPVVLAEVHLVRPRRPEGILGVLRVQVDLGR